jgi:hypothetical protein
LSIGQAAEATGAVATTPIATAQAAMRVRMKRMLSSRDIQ